MPNRRRGRAWSNVITHLAIANRQSSYTPWSQTENRLGTHLGVDALAEDGADGVIVAAEAVHLHLRAHVPDAAHGVAAARHEHVERRVQCDGVDAAQVAVVVADHLRTTLPKG